MMVYEIKIDPVKRRIITIWGESVKDEDIIAYQQMIRQSKDLQGYDELIDFTALENIGIDVTAFGLREVGIEASSADEFYEKSRFAIVVRGPVSLGLARMYEAMRSLQSKSRRTLKIFENLQEAEAWLDEESRKR